MGEVQMPLSKKPVKGKIIWKEEMIMMAIVISLLAIIAILLGAFLFFGVRKNQEAAPVSAVVPTPTSVVPQDAPAPDASGPLTEITGNPSVAAVAEAVARHVFLPKGDVTVTTILDPDSLRKQDPVFYQYAKAGDKVLFYKDRAILYNPTVDRVIDIMHQK